MFVLYLIAHLINMCPPNKEELKNLQGFPPCHELSEVVPQVYSSVSYFSWAAWFSTYEGDDSFLKYAQLVMAALVKTITNMLDNIHY